MDMTEILGALLNQKSGGGGAMGNILGQLLGGAKEKKAATSEKEKRAATSELDDKRARLFVLAMVNAAKADGQLDKKEQDGILGQLGDVSKEEIDFLKKEFAAPTDVREFAWSVPLGEEEHVYGFSLMAIDLDENKEARYLKDLAHGLRLAPDVCNQIHKKAGAPPIYR